MSERGQGGERIPGTENRKVQDLEEGVSLELRNSRGQCGWTEARDGESNRK